MPQLTDEALTEDEGDGPGTWMTPQEYGAYAELAPGGDAPTPSPLVIWRHTRTGDTEVGQTWQRTQRPARPPGTPYR